MVASNSGFFQSLSPKSISLIALTVSVASVGWQFLQPLSHHVTLASPPIMDAGVQNTVNASGASSRWVIILKWWRMWRNKWPRVW